MNDREMVRWDLAKLARFKRLYAKNMDAEAFMFEGDEYVPGYAKYLIEYLETRLGKP
jgi:hypothetical protein